VTADGYTSNPPSGGGGGGPIAIGDVTGLTAALAAKLPIAGGTVTGALVVNGVLEVGTSVTLQIGADTNIYRVSANRLATDDSLDVGGDLLVYGNVDLQGTITGVAVSDVSGLQAALDAKSATGHTHVAANVTDLAETVQDTVGAMVVAGANVTATYNDGAGTLTIAAAGGGGGSSMAVVRSKVTSGNITPGASVPWIALAGGPTLVLAAAEGDYVEFAVVGGMWDPGASFLDLAVMVGGSAVRYLSSDTATPAIEGAPSFYADPQTYHNFGPCFEFEVGAGDLSGGNVTVGFMTRGDGGGTLFASDNYPFRWRAINHGAVSVS
jgi:hypothetical protein